MAVTSVTNDIVAKSCAALFIELTKAFDSVDHHLLL